MTKHVVVNIRGTAGSGKSTSVRNFLHLFKSIAIVDENFDNKVVAHKIFVGGLVIYAIGPYFYSCAGCDHLRDYGQTRIRDLVRILSRSGHVLIEGYDVSESVKKYKELASSDKRKFIFAFMDTPLRVCFKRLHGRRKMLGIKKPLSKKPIALLFKKLKSLKSELHDEGYRVVQLKHDGNLTAQILEVIHANLHSI